MLETVGYAEGVGHCARILLLRQCLDLENLGDTVDDIAALLNIVASILY